MTGVEDRRRQKDKGTNEWLERTDADRRTDGRTIDQRGGQTDGDTNYSRGGRTNTDKRTEPSEKMQLNSSDVGYACLSEAEKE